MATQLADLTRTVISIDGSALDINSLPFNLPNAAGSIAFNIVLVNSSGDVLNDTTANITGLFVKYDNVDYTIEWNANVSKFAILGQGTAITPTFQFLPKQGTTIRPIQMFYSGNAPLTIATVKYFGTLFPGGSRLFLSSNGVTYTAISLNTYYERFRTESFYLYLEDSVNFPFVDSTFTTISDGTNTISLTGNTAGIYTPVITGVTYITANTALALPNSTQTFNITSFSTLGGTGNAPRSVRWDGPMLNNSEVVINGLTGGLDTTYNLYAGRKFPFSLLLKSARGGAPYTLNTITQDSLSLIENTSTYPGYSFLPTSTVGQYKLDDQGSGDSRLPILGDVGSTYSFKVSHSATNYASGGTTLAFNIFVLPPPTPSSVGSTMATLYSSRYLNDTNSLFALPYDTAGNTYIPDDSDRVTFYRNGQPFPGSQVGPSSQSSSVFSLEDYVEGVTGGNTYSAFLQTGTTGITFSVSSFVNVYDIGVSLGSPIIASAPSIYAGVTGDGVTLSVVLRDSVGNLYNNTISNYRMDIYQSLGGDPSYLSSYSRSTTGSTYTFFFDTGPSNIYNNLLTFTYKLTGAAPYPSTELTGVSSADVVVGPRNVPSIVESSLTADPFNVTNRSNVTMTLVMRDALRNVINPGSNTAFIRSLENVSFAREFPGSTTPSRLQDAGVTGRYSFQFSISDGITLPTSQLTFVANYNGLEIDQIETLNYFAKDPSLVPCFFGDAPVLTTKGYVRIDRLKQGDIVVTPDEQTIPIKRVVVTKVAASRETNPYVIPKGMFNATEKLLISPNHKVSVKGRMVESKFLNLRQDYHKGILTYYNIELEKYSNMVVAGVNVETLISAKEVYVTPEQFMASLKKQYGNITQELYESILSKFKVMPDGTIRCFATAK